MATRKPRPQTDRTPRAVARRAGAAKTGKPAAAAPPAIATPAAELLSALHLACVQAGAGAALRSMHDGLPRLRPLLPGTLREHGNHWNAHELQQQLVRRIYAEHGLTPADWEIDGILAIAGPRGDWLPDATGSGMQALLRAWLPDGIIRRTLLRVPLEPLIGSTLRAVASTWAIGRYAQAVCHLRERGALWLPAPATGLLRLAPTRLRQWSLEALRLALPPLRLAARWAQPRTRH